MNYNPLSRVTSGPLDTSYKLILHLQQQFDVHFHARVLRLTQAICNQKWHNNI
jgi:hypothetical protein